MPFVWYEDQDSGVDTGELWTLLRAHGFVTGEFCCADVDTRRRVEALAEGIMVELAASEVASAKAGAA